MVARCVTRCSHAAGRMKAASSALRTGRSTTAGSIGKEKRSYSTRSEPTTGRTCSREIHGLDPANGRFRLVSHTALWFMILRIGSMASGGSISSPLGFLVTAWVATATAHVAPIFRSPRNAISTVLAWAWKICSTMSLPFSTILPTAKTMPAHSAWAGRASRCRAGRALRPKGQHKPSPSPRREAVNSPDFSIPIRPCPVSPKARYARTSRSSPYPPPSTAATWRATTSRSPPAGGTSDRAMRSCPARAASPSARTHRANAPPSRTRSPSSARPPSTST